MGTGESSLREGWYGSPIVRDGFVKKRDFDRIAELMDVDTARVMFTQSSEGGEFLTKSQWKSLYETWSKSKKQKTSQTRTKKRDISGRFLYECLLQSQKNRDKYGDEVTIQNFLDAWDETLGIESSNEQSQMDSLFGDLFDSFVRREQAKEARERQKARGETERKREYGADDYDPELESDDEDYY